MITEIGFPGGTEINGRERGSFYRDSYSVTVGKKGLGARQVYHGIFGYLSMPVQVALRVRNSVAKLVGFAATNTTMSALSMEEVQPGKRAGFLTIEAASDSEVVCGAYEKNMDMWISVLKLSEQDFAISTLVNLKTRSGKIYMAIIKPFHKVVAKYSIRQSLKAGRI
ncbi:DUF2867 domain-containing protein [Marinimicrobium sp. ABcell2]|uniref:DUF2867 domain-containing protein n=1 Tax=Marinimicrobium sp. ABcell2 TaxID=3069751 RepID=UPI0027B0DE7B|nr:DUF2867 domain-containing protein [Marinimicrobium sp. ABcell2]MDQ2078398.1 DUF2867 domain-containing protein [Marinimicrobium sp. ABcell2]